MLTRIIKFSFIFISAIFKYFKALLEWNIEDKQQILGASSSMILLAS